MPGAVGAEWSSQTDDEEEEAEAEEGGPEVTEVCPPDSEAPGTGTAGNGGIGADDDDEMRTYSVVSTANTQTYSGELGADFVLLRGVSIGLGGGYQVKQNSVSTDRLRQPYMYANLRVGLIKNLEIKLDARLDHVKGLEPTASPLTVSGKLTYRF